MAPLSDPIDLRDSIVLLKLARFVSSREQKSIRRDLIPIIPKEVDIRHDDWAKQRRIILKFPKKKIEDSKYLLYQISKVPGILTIIICKYENFNFSTESLSELVNYTLISLDSINETISIKFQAIGSIPFHKRAFLERINKKRELSNELDETAVKIYIECKEENGIVLGRLGYIYSDFKKESLLISEENKVINLSANNSEIGVILFSPYTSIEIADFCRIGLNFNFLDIMFSNENDRVPEILEETSETLFKGINKVKFKVIPSLNDFIKNNDKKYSFLGFSLHATKNVQDLKNSLLKSGKIPCIIVGNEVRGLEYSTQKMIEMFKIGTGSSEPLRSSHVLSYVMGLIS